MQITKYEVKSKIKKMLKELSQSILSYFDCVQSYLLMEELKSSWTIVQRQKNTKEVIINHKGTRMVKDGED